MHAEVTGNLAYDHRFMDDQHHYHDDLSPMTLPEHCPKCGARVWPERVEMLPEGALLRCCGVVIYRELPDLNKAEIREAYRLGDTTNGDNHEPREAICDVCGKTFMTTRSAKKRCSVECSTIADKKSSRDYYWANRERVNRQHRERNRIRRAEAQAHK